MDYSAAIADDPAAASPWGSSSPRAHRTPFAGSVPDSPTGPIRSDTDEAQSRLPEPALETPTGPSLNGQPVPEVQGSDPRQAQQQVRPSSQAQHPHGQQYTQQDQQQQSRPGAVRYHSARQQRQVPQYKLQAKVTALERTGRKDPVLRFDVYVCLSMLSMHTC